MYADASDYIVVALMAVFMIDTTVIMVVVHRLIKSDVRYAKYIWFVGGFLPMASIQYWAPECPPELIRNYYAIVNPWRLRSLALGFLAFGVSKVF